MKCICSWEEDVRQCHKCKVPVTDCSGFVKAGDILELWEGTRAPTDIRELCGKCSIPALFINDNDAEQRIKEVFS